MADLVVCCDGTWNTPDDVDEGMPSPTNVYKLYNAIQPEERNGVSLRYYHPGIGTRGGLVDKIAGGSLGIGLTRIIKSAYQWLAVNYRPGDKIWLFGFSRGAFTARCVCGMVTGYGLLDLSGDGVSESEKWKRVDEVYDRYREKKKTRLKLDYHNGRDGVTPVYFIGVWDTVGSLGVPDDLPFVDLLDNPRDFEFHDTELNANVAHARHALALDEKRQSFIPTLWTGTRKNNDVKQIWFSGVHSDVGGGYAQRGLSDIALAWMMDEAVEQGLPLRDVKDELRPDWKGVLHDTLTGFFKTMPSRPRNVPALVNGSDIHPFALARIANPPISQGQYWKHIALAPGASASCDVFARQHWNVTGFWLEQGVAYDFSATGQWKDASIACGPGGTRDGKFSLGETVQILFSGVGKIEQAYQALSGQTKADFWGTLRYEKGQWFELIGVIANGVKTTRTVDWEQEVFSIGAGASFTPAASGYLYCFANDAWIAYGNNVGSVRLTVKRG